MPKKRKPVKAAETTTIIEGGDIRGVVGATQVIIENQNFYPEAIQPAVHDASRGPWAPQRANSPGWYVPYPRNPHFTGRGQAIGRLREELQSGKPAAVTQAIAGLGGIGKTQLALEYCYHEASAYHLVWWVRAESKKTRVADLEALAERLFGAAGSESNSLRHVLDWLNQTSGWLIVFDNAEHPDDLIDVLPVAGRGHVLITSRYAAWGARARTLSLAVWSAEEATDYLLRRTNEENIEPNRLAAAALCDALGYLPLAVEQAAAYIEESKVGISSYTSLFSLHQLRLLKPRTAKGSKGQRTIATVWDISLQSIERASPSAVALLQLCAFMRPDQISKKEIELHHGLLPEPLRTTASDSLTLHDTIAILRRYSLVDATPEFISIHRLVQLVVRDRLDPRDYRKFHEAADRLEHMSTEAPGVVLEGESETEEAMNFTDDERATGNKPSRGIALTFLEVVETRFLGLAKLLRWVYSLGKRLRNQELPGITTAVVLIIALTVGRLMLLYLDEFIQVIKAILPDKDFETFGRDPHLLILVFALALLPISAALVRNRRYGPAATAFLLSVLLSTGFYLTRPPGRGASPTFTLHPGKLFISGDIVGASHRQLPLAECERLCKAESRCLAFTYDQVQQACYLKQIITSMHDSPTAMSGVKE